MDDCQPCFVAITGLPTHERKPCHMHSLTLPPTNPLNPTQSNPTQPTTVTYSKPNQPAPNSPPSSSPFFLLSFHLFISVLSLMKSKTCGSAVSTRCVSPFSSWSRTSRPSPPPSAARLTKVLEHSGGSTLSASPCSTSRGTWAAAWCWPWWMAPGRLRKNHLVMLNQRIHQHYQLWPW